VNSSGNIGVGTANPAYKLDVNGNTNILGNEYISGNLGIGTITPATKLHINDTANDVVLYSRATNIRKNSILRLHANYDSIKENNGNER
jgi:hypothetical protein